MSLKKSIFPRIATCAMLLCVATLSVSAADGTVQADGGLRLRSEASITADTISLLPNGSTVDVLADTGDGWYQVSYNGSTGYSFSDYIVLAEGVTVPAVQEDDTVYIQVTQGPLNIRSGPGTSYSKVGSLSAGTLVPVVSAADGWYQIAAGYISADYATVVDIASVTATQSLGQEIVDYALQFLGCRYSYGGTSPSGFDCSGFVQYVFKNFGITLNRTSSSQYSNGVAVSKSQLQPGDTLYFSKSSSGSITHTGIYIGNNQFVHASDYGVGVIVSDLNSSYYASGYVGARRMI